MKKSQVLVAALLAACNSTPPQLLPPPFGPEAPGPTRLFFPTGLAKTNEGGLLIANGNFNHAYDAGTVVGLSRAFLDGIFRLKLDCGQATRDPACIRAIPQDRPTNLTGVVMIGNYAGPLVLDATGTAAYVGSRDSAMLNGVSVGTGGTLGCVAGGGQGDDCRKGLIDLQPLGVDGPYTVVAGDTVLPGTSIHQPALFVSSVIPHIESISSGIINSSTAVAVLNMQDPTQVLFTLRAAQPFVAGGHAVGPMVFDPVRRQLYLSGCYARSISFGAGEPGSSLCFGEVNNFLRILNVDAAGIADPLLIDVHADVLSTITTQLLLSDPDAVTGAPTTLWATMTGPDSLVRFELPAQPSVAPRVRQIIPLPVSPADMVRIDRGAAPALLAVVSEKLNAVSIVDTGTHEVVAQAGRLGDSPFMLREISCPSESTGSACLATTVFGDCRVALIEVNKAQPSLTAVRGLVGSCP
jgi:hypothetical protein